MSASALYCPKCARRYDLRHPSRSLRVRCPACGAVLGNDAAAEKWRHRDAYIKKELGGCRTQRHIATGLSLIHI